MIFTQFFGYLSQLRDRYSTTIPYRAIPFNWLGWAFFLSLLRISSVEIIQTLPGFYFIFRMSMCYKNGNFVPYLFPNRKKHTLSIIFSRSIRKYGAKNMILTRTSNLFLFYIFTDGIANIPLVYILFSDTIE